MPPSMDMKFSGDPGCGTLLDTTETCVPGTGCSHCDDGIDNDGDGLFDESDESEFVYYVRAVATDGKLPRPSRRPPEARKTVQ